MFLQWKNCFIPSDLPGKPKSRFLFALHLHAPQRAQGNPAQQNATQPGFCFYTGSFGSRVRPHSHPHTAGWCHSPPLTAAELRREWEKHSSFNLQDCVSFYGYYRLITKDYFLMNKWCIANHIFFVAIFMNKKYFNECAAFIERYGSCKDTFVHMVAALHLQSDCRHQQKSATIQFY